MSSNSVCVESVTNEEVVVVVVVVDEAGDTADLLELPLVFLDCVK